MRSRISIYGVQPGISWRAPGSSDSRSTSAGCAHSIIPRCSTPTAGTARAPEDSLLRLEVGPVRRFDKNCARRLRVAVHLNAAVQLSSVERPVSRVQDGAGRQFIRCEEVPQYALLR